MNNIISELNKRGIFKEITNKDKFDKLPSDAGVYIGFDPSAQSLHLGNYIQITILKRFGLAGFKPVAIVGGATGMIGDPSGKSQERNLLDNNVLINNKAHIKKQLEKFGLEVFDNLDFYKNMTILEFLRDVGKNININYMINKDIVQSRLESGISFTEFSYTLIQGWDFKELYQNKNVYVQIGGSDQWGNITTGIEMIRKVIGDDNKAVGIVTNLLTTSTGKKFGKSEGNAIWIDAEMTSPFQMYQHLLNWEDADIEKLLKWMTFLSVEQIDEIMKKHNEKPFEKQAQKALAFEIVKDIHGIDAANEAISITNTLFVEGDVTKLTIKNIEDIKSSIPFKQTNETNLTNLLIEAGISTSKRDARELINNNSIEYNGTKINNPDFIIDKKLFNGKYSLIKKGKRNYFLVGHN